jgi:hypothetical protein
MLLSRDLDPPIRSVVETAHLIVSIPTQVGIQSHANPKPVIAPTAVGRPQSAHSWWSWRLLAS